MRLNIRFTDGSVAQFGGVKSVNEYDDNSYQIEKNDGYLDSDGDRVPFFIYIPIRNVQYIEEIV